MAADFELRSEMTPLPRDFRERLDELLPRAHTWSAGLEMWGEEDGNRIDVWPVPNFGGGDVLVRADMRAYDHAWGTRVFLALRALGRELWPV